jgi:hypothetical protein
MVKYRCIQYNRLGAERLLILNIILSLQTVCLVPSLGYPTSAVRALRFRQGTSAAVRALDPKERWVKPVDF